MLRDPSASNVSPIALTPNATRPDAGGTAGKRVNVRTNFFAIKKLQVDVIWQYDVSITPEIPVEKARKLWKVVESTFPELHGKKMVFDGMALAYAADDLKVDKVRRKVELPDAGGAAPAPASAHAAASSSSAPKKNKNEFTVAIAMVARIDLGELQAFLSKTGPLTPGCLMAIQGLNIAMTHKLFSQMVSVGRSAYTPDNAQNLGGGIEKWDGIFQSIRPGQGQLYANIDVASTAFIKGGNVVDLIMEITNTDPNGLKRLGKRDFASLQKHFKGSAFTVTHRGASFKKRYKVSELSMISAEQIKFDQETNDGKKRKITIPTYYKAAYNLQLKYPFLPCIGVKGREGQMMYFPVEVCSIVSGKRYTKKLNELQTTAMIKGTCMNPQKRAEKIANNFRILDFEHNEYMKKFGMEVSKEMTVVPARVLPPPRVSYGNNVQVTPQFGSWQLNPQRKMVQGATLKSWGVLVYEPPGRLREDTIRNFLRELTSTLAENGMNVVQRDPPIMYGQIGNVNKNVESMLHQIKESSKVPADLILVVMPNKCQTYSAIKTYCETVHKTGVITQCALSKNITRVNKQYCGNLGLKINSKLGGMNNRLAPQMVPFLAQKPTMILGADVTHPAPGENKPSVVAVVASMDKDAFRYAGRIKAQESRQEVIEGLKYLVYQLLCAFKAQPQNRVYPERILFYRDGVSEGQFEAVMANEVSAVREACNHINETERRPQPYNPKITFCVVKKRHHARLFPMNANEADRSGNCVAGTVVDTVITHPTEFDFYLQSHGGLQGTSRPTLYHVLLDENNFTSDSLQELTYRLCHVYARCTKSVSIVPSVYYAHLLAFRARHYQGGDFSDTASSSSGSSASGPTFETSANLKNVMYFV
ncbi:hypothetical protein EDD11_010343 [Mortierella claussenii]|nr:hypothetical protein EDD11_010343 [Mortierella claussenii]